MAAYNLINSVIAIATRMSAEIGTTQSQFTLECIEVMRSKVRKDHWELLTELERSDDLGRHLANSIITNLFHLAFSNIKSARVFDTNTLEIILTDNTLLRITDPAKREQK